MLPGQVLEVLKERIVDRVYAPGQRLNIDALSRELDVSPTPIREALGHLQAQGLAVSEPYVGFSVAPMPGNDYFSQLYDFRLVLEPWAASLAATRRDPRMLKELETLLAAMDKASLATRYSRFRSFTEADAAFHQAIVAGAGNEPALAAYVDLKVHLHLSRLFIDREPQTAQARKQHREVFDAIRRGDPVAAAERMRAHLVESKGRLVELPDAKTQTGN